MARIVTTAIPETQCIGDSLTTINTNFENLDTRLEAVSSAIPTNVTSEEIGYLANVESDIQTQLDGKVPSSFIPAGVTSEEIGYLANVESDIQTQLNGKVNDGGGIVNSVAKWSTANTITDSSITFVGNNVKVEAGKFLYAYGNVAGATQRNIAFGGALTHMTTAGGNNDNNDHNVGFGALAGHNLQRGGYNTFIGTGAGYWETATNTDIAKGGNTIVGSYSGWKFDPSGTDNLADGNTVVGAFSLSPPGGASGSHVVRANGNTVIGSNALSNCGNADLYEHNVIIGRFAGGALSNGATNCIHIGYNCQGSATGNSNVCRIGNTSITSTHITGIYTIEGGDDGRTVTVNANNRLASVTSSLRYKKDIETAEVEYSENIIYNSRPVYYRPKTVSEEHREGWSYWGFIAEELAELDPRMVYWAYKPEDYEEYVSYVDPRTGEEARDRRVKEGAERVPDSVFYERFTVHLVKVAQKQKQEIEELKSTVQQLKAGNEALEARLQALEAK